MRSSKVYRHFIEFYGEQLQDECGELLHRQKVFECRADVLVRSGNQLANYGTVVTSEIITIDMYNHKSLKNDLLVCWNNVFYQILHIKPTPDERKVIVTAEKQHG